MKLDPHLLLSPKYAFWIIRSLILLFSVLILFELVSWFWSGENWVTPVVESKNPVGLTKNNSGNDILNSNFFGVYVPDDVNEVSIKKSMLDVTLAGIILSDKPEESHVIIRSSSGNEKNYKIGDLIPGGALIKRITAEGVLVERDGVIESITLPKDALSFEPAPNVLKEEETP